MMWVSTRDQSELTDDQALTGVTNLFMEVCARMDIDPHVAIDAFFKTSIHDRAESADDDIT